VGDRAPAAHRPHFGALALAVTAMARSYDFFMYYFTLLITR